MVPEDAAWAGALAASTGHPAYRPERLVEALTSNRTLARAEASELGFALFALVPPEAELHIVAVAPAARRTGVGRALLEVAHDDLRERGVQCVFLEVAEDNSAGRGLYASLGYIEVARRPRYYPSGATALVLRLDLDGGEG